MISAPECPPPGSYACGCGRAVVPQAWGLLLPRPASRGQRIEGNKVSAEFANPDDLNHPQGRVGAALSSWTPPGRVPQRLLGAGSQHWLLEKPGAGGSNEAQGQRFVSHPRIDFHLLNGGYLPSWQNARLLHYLFRPGPHKLTKVCQVRDSWESRVLEKLAR